MPPPTPDPSGVRDLLRARVRALPKRPGTYLFRDAAGRVLYVGKARSLKVRVSSYFSRRAPTPATHALISRAADVETIVTRTEAEALALEASLIQRHDPPFNVRLADDSSFLYVRISPGACPTVTLTRRVLPDGAWYRGPYPRAAALRTTLRTARAFFPWCAYPDPCAPHAKPCFASHLGLCPGICAGRLTIEEYAQGIRGLQQFLDGDTTDARRILRARMAEASARQEYERAASLRDALAAIAEATEPQHVVTPRRESVDAVGLARAGNHSVVAILSVRHGRVSGTRVFLLHTPVTESAGRLLRGFLVSYLPRAAGGARSLLLPEPVQDQSLLARAGAPVLQVPRRGWRLRLVELATTNAAEAHRRAAAEREHPTAVAASLRELARALRLPSPPHRIEAYDISNLAGTLATGAMIVFLDGRPKPSAYRRFRITSVVGANDVAMLREVLTRRFARHARGTAKTDEWPVPDLLLIDGGKAQRNVALRALAECGLPVPVVALAKRAEEIYLPGRAAPLRLPPTSPALSLLQRARDEAHRFTVSYHRLLRGKRLSRSLLADLPGVGPKTRAKLFRHFGSLRALRDASAEALAAVVGKQRARLLQVALAVPSAGAADGGH